MTISLKPITIQMDDLLLLKLLQFAGFGASDVTLSSLDENSFESQRFVRRRHCQLG